MTHDKKKTEQFQLTELSYLINMENYLYRYDNFCVTKTAYIMNNVQDYSVLYNNAVRTDYVRVGMWKAFA